jgi:hypothetical protein
MSQSMPQRRDRVRSAFKPVLRADVAPSLAPILRLGRELHDARLDEDFIVTSIRGAGRGAVYARGMLSAATHGPEGHVSKGKKPEFPDASELEAKERLIGQLLQDMIRDPSKKRDFPPPNDSEARDGHVLRLLRDMDRDRALWLHVRDELVKFATAADAELAARTPAVPGPPRPPKGIPGEYFVTLDQAAALVNRTKRTLEKLKKQMPPPRVKGGGGKAAEWAWSELRPWLEEKFERPLPEVPPHAAGR